MLVSVSWTHFFRSEKSLRGFDLGSEYVERIRILNVLNSSEFSCEQSNFGRLLLYLFVIISGHDAIHKASLFAWNTCIESSLQKRRDLNQS